MWPLIYTIRHQNPMAKKSCKNLCNFLFYAIQPNRRYYAKNNSISTWIIPCLFIFTFYVFLLQIKWFVYVDPKKNWFVSQSHLKWQSSALSDSCGEKSWECHLSDSLFLISFLKDSIFHGIISFSNFSAFFLQNKCISVHNFCYISNDNLALHVFFSTFLFLGSRIGRLWVIWTAGVVELWVRTCQSTLIDLYFAFWACCNYWPMLHWLFSVGVLEADFVQPSHNKQDFERTSLFQKLEVRLKEMTWEYW